MVIRRKNVKSLLLLGSWVALLTTCLLLAVGRIQAQEGTGRSGSPDNPLLVATKSLEPFIVIDDDVPSGFSVEVWEELAARLNLSYEWVVYDTVPGLLAAVENGDVDVAISGISMTRDRETVLDFTHSYFDAGLQIMTRPGEDVKLSQLLKLFFSPSLLNFLALALVATFIMSHIILVIERHKDPEFPRGYVAGLSESVWYLLTMVANGSYPRGDTRSPLLRGLVIAFWLAGLLLVAQFTATVTSSLTIQGLNSSIHGPDDLPGKEIATVDGSTAASYLSERDIAFLGVARIDDAYPLLIDGTVDAIVFDAAVLQHYSVTHGKSLVNVVGVIFKLEKYGIALKRGSPLRKSINEVLLEMYQDGTLEATHNRWFGE